MDELKGKHIDLTLSKPDQLYRLARALASPVRLRMLQVLGQNNLNVGELAQALDIPMSTAALAVKTLEEAGLIATEAQPGARGSMKLCSRRMDSIAINLQPEDEQRPSTLVMQIPIGGYSSAHGIKATCGLAGESALIGEMDNPSAFYMPDRFGAQLIWFRQGALEYRFAHVQMHAIDVDWLEVSFEACSEAPMYRDPWKSDITVSINGKRLGTWTCPCDCGGRSGRLTPEWWPALSTQFGFLKTWRVTHEGSYLENQRIGDTTIEDLAIHGQKYISVTIEVAPDAKNAGGINLFGERFGDHPQSLMLCLGYHMRQEEARGTNNL